METYLIYIGKAALAAGAFYLVFLALFQNQKQFTFNRIYLPVSLALSFIIPLITFTTVNYVEPVPVESNPVPVFTESFEPVVMQQSQPQFIWEWYHYLFAIYAAGTFLFLFRLMLGHGKAWNIISKSRVQQLFNNLVNISKKDIHPFSFFNKIVLSENTLSHPNLKIIVEHENIHVKEKHTLDILFTEILFLLQWFNPFAWLLKDAVKNNLEYKTDHEIAKTTDTQTYQLAMLTLAGKQGVAPFLTALNGSQLKSRIIMMKKKNRNKYAWLKQLVVLPLLALLVMGLANKEVKTEYIQQDTKIRNEVPPKNALTHIVKSKNLIQGKVIEEITGKPVPNASIVLEGLDEVTATDENGNYQIQFGKNEKPVVLNVSAKGYYTNKVVYYGTNEKIDVLLGKIEIKKSDNEVKTEFVDSEKLITGNVFNEKLEFIEGAVIQIEGTEIRTTTNSDGTFKLETEKMPVTVIISKENYDTYYITLEEVFKFAVMLKHEGITHRLKYSSNITPKLLTQNSSEINDIDKFYNTIINEPLIYSRAEEMPEFPGGNPAMLKFMHTRMNYPESARKKGIEGIVYVSVIIDKKGNVTNAKPYRFNESLDEEALRLVNSLPRWTPGKQDGKPVNVKIAIPVKFDLDELEYNKQDIIQGKVTNEKGEPIDGASVVVEGRNFGVVTNSKGNYQIEIEPTDEVLIFGYLYHDKQKVKIGGKDKIDVQIRTDRNPPTSGIFLTSSFKMRNTRGNMVTPVYLVNEEEVDIEEVDRHFVESFKTLPDSTAIKIYGQKGKNGIIILKLKNPEDLNKISGRVTNEKGEPIEGAIIKCKELKLETLTKSDGTFTLNGIKTPVTISILKEGYDNHEVTLDGVNNFTAQLTQNGFPRTFDIKQTSIKKTNNITSAKTSGKKQVIGKINWLNNEKYSSGELTNALGVKEGDEYSKKIIEERAYGEVSSLYLDDGYLFFNIKITEKLRNDNTVDLEFTLSEGTRWKIGKIDITGNKAVSDEDYLNKIEIRPGDVFSRSKLVQSVRSLNEMINSDTEIIDVEVNPDLVNQPYEFNTVHLEFKIAQK